MTSAVIVSLIETVQHKAVFLSWSNVIFTEGLWRTLQDIQDPGLKMAYLVMIREGLRGSHRFLFSKKKFTRKHWATLTQKNKTKIN